MIKMRALLEEKRTEHKRTYILIKKYAKDVNLKTLAEYDPKNDRYVLHGPNAWDFKFLDTDSVENDPDHWKLIK